jgi:hypothetical protein
VGLDLGVKRKSFHAKSLNFRKSKTLPEMSSSAFCRIHDTLELISESLNFLDAFGDSFE